MLKEMQLVKTILNKLMSLIILIGIIMVYSETAQHKRVIEVCKGQSKELTSLKVDSSTQTAERRKVLTRNKKVSSKLRIRTQVLVYTISCINSLAFLSHTFLSMECGGLHIKNYPRNSSWILIAWLDILF